MLLILVEVSVKVAYSGGSIFESSLVVHESHRLKAQSYLHVTYSGGSVCVSGLSVHTVTRSWTDKPLSQILLPE